MDMMFDLSYSVSGEDEPFKMKFNEVIFVMEDVDCASKAWTALAQFRLLPSVYDHLQKMRYMTTFRKWWLLVRK